jgi:uncharacterized protein
VALCATGCGATPRRCTLRRNGARKRQDFEAAALAALLLSLAGMRWQRGHVSPDVIDRRGAGGGGFGLLGILMLLLRSRLGWVGILLALVVLIAYGGSSLLQGTDRPGAVGQGAGSERGPGSEPVQFVSFVLDDAQDVWQRVLAERDQAYQRAKLVLFTDRTSTGCGYGSAATGPFYCPRDRRVYLDLGFFAALERRFGAAGDFARAYVIAHEVGHHVQEQLGTLERVHRAPAAARQGAEGLAVRNELQADCFAGIWANSTGRRDLLEAGDIEEALQAAAAIGDDRIQRAATGTVQPESWTHGSAEQRARWFRRGYDTGVIDACDAFTARRL